MASTHETPAAASRMGKLKRIGGATLGVLFLALSLLATKYDAWEYEGPSMEPTLFNGDRVLSESAAPEEILRGDVVVVQSPSDGVNIIKRVVALPGDVVAVQNGTLVLNGTPLAAEDLGPCKDGRGAQTSGCRVVRWEIGGRSWRTSSAVLVSDVDPITVGNGVYLIGDHLDQSNDSRNPALGVVAFGAILGKVTRRYFSSQTGRVGWERLD